jgi:hypothetical protein
MFIVPGIIALAVEVSTIPTKTTTATAQIVIDFLILSSILLTTILSQSLHGLLNFLHYLRQENQIGQMCHETFSARYVIGHYASSASRPSYAHTSQTSLISLSSLLRPYFSNFSSLSGLPELTGTSARSKDKPYIITFSLQE